MAVPRMRGMARRHKHHPCAPGAHRTRAPRERAPRARLNTSSTSRMEHSPKARKGCRHKNEPFILTNAKPQGCKPRGRGRARHGRGRPRQRGANRRAAGKHAERRKKRKVFGGKKPAETYRSPEDGGANPRGQTRRPLGGTPERSEASTGEEVKQRAAAPRARRHGRQHTREKPEKKGDQNPNTRHPKAENTKQN